MPVPDPQTPERHVRMRRLKRLLRYVPRRAVFHRYPVIGRFADSARQRAYLWSFRPEHVRPAVYFGSILALLPVMGVQLPIALLLAVFLRGNFMIAGALQLITNPLSAAPIYFATYQVGRWVLGVLGFGAAGDTPDASPGVEPSATMLTDIGIVEELAHSSHGSSTVTLTVVALIVGGAFCGLALGALLDGLYQLGIRLRSQSATRGTG